MPIEIVNFLKWWSWPCLFYILNPLPCHFTGSIITLHMFDWMKRRGLISSLVDSLPPIITTLSYSKTPTKEERDAIANMSPQAKAMKADSSSSRCFLVYVVYFKVTNTANFKNRLGQIAYCKRISNFNFCKDG